MLSLWNRSRWFTVLLRAFTLLDLNVLDAKYQSLTPSCSCFALSHFETPVASSYTSSEARRTSPESSQKGESWARVYQRSHTDYSCRVFSVRI